MPVFHRALLVSMVFLLRLPRRSAFAGVLSHLCRPALPTRQQRFFQRSRLCTTEEVPVDISPADHGTKPLRSFQQKDVLDHRLQRALESQGYKTPTPIQAHGIPLLLAGHDVMASAQTGTGKTLLFSIPLCQKLLQSQKTNNNGPAALILNPTRELAQQTAAALKSLDLFRVALATGGASVSQQRRQLADCDILVGTPGRVWQFVQERRALTSSQPPMAVVVDEADRMLDLGFEPQLRQIARAWLGRKNSTNNNDDNFQKQSILCSATFPAAVQRVASEFLRPEYYFCAAGRVGAVNPRIQQELLWVTTTDPRSKRTLTLQHVQSFLQKQKQKRTKQGGVLVFANTKDHVEQLGAALKKQQQNASTVRVVTGDRAQHERDKSLQDFSNGKAQVLVATDVAARGLDVASVGLVIQADAPRDADTFVHRVGRTGRAGNAGRAVALLDGRSLGIAPALVKLLQEARQDVPSWLWGMSHVATARVMEEEGAIHAGGGSSLDADIASDESSEILNDQFSVQDFRSRAETGSWGSERDKSYHAFDNEAYRSLDGIVTTDTEESSTDDDDDDDDDALDAGTDTESTTGMDPVSLGSVDPRKLDEARFPAVTNTATQPVFVRQEPSKELRQALRDMTGSENVADKPSRKILTAISKRGADQRLRFEYLGMFPFAEVSELLVSSRKSGNEKYGDMPKLLMVAEKPSIAKAIADALSGQRGPRQRRGISRALPVYEFTSDAFVPSGERDGKPTRSLVTVTSVVGHVFSLGFLEEEKGKESRSYSDPSEYFRLPVVKQEESSTGKLRVVDHLRALASDCDHLVLWLDCDAEGENIAHEVIGVTRRALEQRMAEEQKSNPDSSPVRRIHRARFSAITGEAIRDAFGNLVEPDAELSRSVDARQELDLRVGVAMTRLLTWKCVGAARRHFSPSTKLVSYGPCQTPALSFCVDRAREIEAFEPRNYWKVNVSASSINGNNGSVQLRWKPPEKTAVEQTRQSRSPRNNDSEARNFEEGATFDKALAERAVREASSPSAIATVTHVEQLSEKIKAPVGLNTVGLLAAGSKAMGMSPKQVMNVAEKLYSAGFISYPRTETTRYDPKGFDVRSALRQHSTHSEWGPTASHLLRTKYKTNSRPPLRGHDAGDHPPITPLKVGTREKVGHGAAWRVYEFVARTFLGSLSDDLQFTRRLAHLKVGPGRGNTSDDVDGDAPWRHFELEQVSVDSLGFAGACPWVLRDIGAESRKSADQNDSRGAALEKGSTLKIANARMEVCTTKPPAFLQEHELIERMDQNRIGTDASMAQHVNNIVDRGYVALCDHAGTPLRPPPRPGQPRSPRQIGRYLVPTPLGIALMDLFGSSGRGQGDVGENNVSPVHLSRPSIRAQMESEVKQIATGSLDKASCLEKNLSWFEARYGELESSLSRQRINEFAIVLAPTKVGLLHWKGLGAFEEVSTEREQPQRNKGHNKRNSSNKGNRGGTNWNKRQKTNRKGRKRKVSVRAN